MNIDKFQNDNRMSGKAYVYSAYAKSKIADHHGAIEDLQKAIELHPCCADAYFQMGCYRGMMGDAKGAMIDLEKATELDPKYEEERLSFEMAKKEMF